MPIFLDDREPIIECVSEKLTYTNYQLANGKCYYYVCYSLYIYFQAILFIVKYPNCG